MQFPAKFLAWSQASLPAQLPKRYWSTDGTNHPYIPTMLHQFITAECEPVQLRDGMKRSNLELAFV